MIKEGETESARVQVEKAQTVKKGPEASSALIQDFRMLDPDLSKTLNLS